MSDEPTFYEDMVRNGVSVVTVFDHASQRWTTTVVGGPIDGWSTTYRDEADPVIQHARAVETARGAG